MTTRCAVLGSPIAHSLSPALHRAAYDALGLNWTYDAHDVDEARLPAFLRDLDGTWRGLSLTMPLKQVAVGCVDEISDTARLVDAVNTIVIDGTGRRAGDNTDVPGMVNALHERAVTSAATGAVLGGGATARSALAALRGLVASATVFARTPARTDELLSTAGDLGLACTVRRWEDRGEALGAPLVLVTTPTGATDDLARLVPESPGVLLDVVYNTGPTPLSLAWAAAGGAVVNGLDLLVHQAAVQVWLMTGQTVHVGLLREAGRRVLAARAAVAR